MDQYKILGRIGEGAHGIVFKAKHIESGEIVALKKVILQSCIAEITRRKIGFSVLRPNAIKLREEIYSRKYIVLSLPLPSGRSTEDVLKTVDGIHVVHYIVILRITLTLIHTLL